MKKLLTDYNKRELEEIVLSLGEKKFRATQIFQAISLQKDFGDMTAISKEFREKLSQDYDAVGVRILEKLVSRDGTEKYLYALRDGNVIEGVLMRYKYGNTLCVSTQVGCRMGCKFCASGIGGLVRNLSAGEIIGQIIAVNRDQGGDFQNREVTNIVLMGSGEPLDNYDNVLKFFDLCRDEYGISLRNISLSTSGLADKVKMLADSGYAVTLTISLHSPDDKVREGIMPVNRAFNLSALINSARYYFEKTGKNKVYWAHFTGRATKEILCECKMLESGIYKVGYSDALLLHLDRMISEFRMHSSSAVCLSLLHSVFAEFCRLMMSGAFGGERREMILSIAQKMESNLTNDECIGDYAAECNLSRDRFVHLFKEVTGWSPYRYMLNIRMEKAERLLRFSSATVSEIALTLGFCDPLYFSRIFKKHVGVSPTEYRGNGR